MCGFRMETSDGTAALPYGTSTLTGSGLVVALATAAISASIVIGVIVLVQSLT